MHVPHDDPSQRLLRGDPSNAAVLYFLRTSEGFSFVLSDESSPGSDVPTYRVDAAWVKQAMAAALVGSVFPLLKEMAEKRNEPELQEACASEALFGFCQRERCTHRHAVGKSTEAKLLA